ncbi:hypothetical protein FEM08_16170 [Flavobacterium gilvum]|nr:hypothetical protein FEM08_16170 [Flavobacterium gilvum]
MDAFTLAKKNERKHERIKSQFQKKTTQPFVFQFIKYKIIVLIHNFIGEKPFCLTPNF